MKTQKIEFILPDGNETSISYVEGPPFDGKNILIKTGAGWAEAYWVKADADEGFYWCVLDDTTQVEWDEATHWCPLPEIEE